MRAWQLHELGEPGDKLAIHDVDPPDGPAAGQITLDVRATGLAFPDVLSCRGEYQVKTKVPYTPGGETAGVVTAVGEGVDDLAEGDRVMVLGGGLQEQVNVGAGMTWKIPDGLSFAAAAALPVNYGTTWFALHNRAQVQAGETLLVGGGSGGVGSSAIQLGKAAGATVIAIAGGDEKVELCRRLGADHVVDYKTAGAGDEADLVTQVRELSVGGVDVAYDPVGGDLFHQIRRTMAWDGRLLIIGFVDAIADAPTNHALLKNYSIVGVHWGASLMRNPQSVTDQMHNVLALTETGAVDPLLYPPFAFEDAAQALQDLADRKLYGKAVVEQSE
ncbi:MAG: NADPH:quinone oxidoreductase family protein [Acidimicrobiales bacterium]|nr:NADPH:quinone oxidoreductase family protein [Acidimicrobiales bacterium]